MYTHYARKQLQVLQVLLKLYTGYYHTAFTNLIHCSGIVKWEIRTVDRIRKSQDLDSLSVPENSRWNAYPVNCAKRFYNTFKFGI